jgi:regulatory protein YycI of two-component signal transduction system YycFG
MIKLKKLIKEAYVWERKFGEKLPTLDSVQKKHQNKINEASYSPKEVKNIIYDMKDYVDKLVKQGEDYEIFQSAKSSAKALKKIQKLLKQVG